MLEYIITKYCIPQREKIKLSLAYDQRSLLFSTRATSKE